MKIIIGLGNPGKKYEKNRHNAGAMFVDYAFGLADKFKLFKTDTFMNESGPAVRKIMINNQCSIINLIVVHDDLDIKLGEFKIQMGRGPRLHNGIESVEKALGTTDFWRVRIGVDNRNPENRIPGEKYVLMNFADSELIILKEVFKEIIQQLEQGVPED